MIFITIFTAIILIGLLITLINKRKNSGLFKRLSKYDYESITPEFSLEELDNLPLDDERIVKEYESIANMLLEKFGITVWTQGDTSPTGSHLWSYWFTSKYKGDFLSSDKNYPTRQEALRAAFIHILKEKWI
jgi:hypothetical protein